MSRPVGQASHTGLALQTRRRPAPVVCKDRHTSLTLLGGPVYPGAVGDPVPGQASHRLAGLALHTFSPGTIVASGGIAYRAASTGVGSARYAAQSRKRMTVTGRASPVTRSTACRIAPR